MVKVVHPVGLEILVQLKHVDIQRRTNWQGVDWVENEIHWLRSVTTSAHLYLLTVIKLVIADNVFIINIEQNIVSTNETYDQARLLEKNVAS